MAVTLTVNGCVHNLAVDPDKPLLWVLREDLGLMGTKYGCGIGQCRSCTVLVDGRPVQSCLYSLSAAEGSTIRTIEGLDDDLAQTLREAWIAAGSSQCGYCQPGQVVAAYALLEDNPSPTDEEIASGMPNLCRCGSYPRIQSAVRAASDALQGSE